MIFGGFSFILFFCAVTGIFTLEQKGNEESFNEPIWILIAVVLFFGFIIVNSINLKNFKKKLELKLTDREKVSKINEALEHMHSRIVFTEDYIIIFNKEIFETSQVSYINPYFGKEYRSIKIMLDVYFKNEKKPKKICLISTRFSHQAKPIMMDLELAFEKIREANISVGEVTVRY